MSVTPNDSEILEALRSSLNEHGDNIGIKKHLEHLKAAHPDWILGAKRLRTIRIANTPEAPPPTTADPLSNLPAEAEASTSTASVPTVDAIKENASYSHDGNDTVKLHLILEVVGDGRRFNFLEDVPADICEENCSREYSTSVIDKIIKAKETWLLKRTIQFCSAKRCEKMATDFMDVPLVALSYQPPTVGVLSFPVCELDPQSPCFAEVYRYTQLTLQDAPKVQSGSVYVYHPKDD